MDRVAEAAEVTTQFRWRWFDSLCLYFPCGFLALLNRHWNIYYKDVGSPAWNGIESFFFFLPFGFYLSMLLRWLRERVTRQREAPLPVQTAPQECPHCRQGCVVALAGDRDYANRLAVELGLVFARKYFRTRVHGIEKIPDRGPAIILMNRGGMAFPWEFTVLGAELAAYRQKVGWLRLLMDRIFVDNTLLDFLFPKGYAELCGGIAATFANFQSLMKHRYVALYSPEGVAGAAKGWRRRYQLQPFHTSFVKLAAQYNATLVPVACIGAENMHPYALNARRIARFFKAPWVSVSPLTPLIAAFPTLALSALPVRLDYYVLDPVQLPAAPYERFCEDDWWNLAEGFRVDLQEQITQLRAGKVPPRFE